MKKNESTKASVERVAASVGVEVEDTSTQYDVCIFLYTPKGKVFRATDCHTAATSFPRYHSGDSLDSYSGTKAEGWGHAMEDLNYGVEDCDEPNCDYCGLGLRNV